MPKWKWKRRPKPIAPPAGRPRFGSACFTAHTAERRIATVRRALTFPLLLVALLCAANGGGACAGLRRRSTWRPRLRRRARARCVSFADTTSPSKELRVRLAQRAGPAVRPRCRHPASKIVLIRVTMARCLPSSAARIGRPAKCGPTATICWRPGRRTAGPSSRSRTAAGTAIPLPIIGLMAQRRPSSICGRWSSLS